MKKNKKLSGLDKYIIFSFVCIITYTVVSIVLALKTEMELGTLTTCFFACFGGEILSCAMIKRLKLKNENSEGDDQNE
jgi:hypothetical protein